MADSVWRAIPSRDEETSGRLRETADVAVVGAGITGITTAIQLARAGLDVCVLEARRVGAGTTGASTGKISLLQGTKLSRIARRRGRRAAADYVAANRAGQAWLVESCRALGLAVQERTAVTYAAHGGDLREVEEECEAAAAAGLPVVWRDEDDVPFSYAGGVTLGGQYQVDPLEIVTGLAAHARSLGVRIHEDARVTARVGHTLRTTRGLVRAPHIVMASGTPVPDRGAFFARLSAERSYAIAWRGLPPRSWDMYLSAGSPVRSVRDAPGLGPDALVVGGSSHVVGRTASERAHLADLRGWARASLPEAHEIGAWSAQDYRPVGELPYVGPLTPAGADVLVATGFDKWGLAMACAAASVLTGVIAGPVPAWAETLRPWTGAELSGLGPAARQGGRVAVRAVTDRLRLARADAARPREGTGVVAGSPARPVATTVVDGRCRSFSATCPHLGGVVAWNDAERTWDCPLHGSRFDAAGRVLEGPATRPLAPRGDPGDA